MPRDKGGGGGSGGKHRGGGSDDSGGSGGGRRREDPGPCPLCNGDGVITVRRDGANDDEKTTQTIKCDTCNGTGKA
jgi:DnaJ-class molecular chaperone